MAHFLQPSVVNYACSCGILNPLTKAYFCRHCLKLRCGQCTSHEVIQKKLSKIIKKKIKSNF